MNVFWAIYWIGLGFNLGISWHKGVLYSEPSMSVGLAFIWPIFAGKRLYDWVKVRYGDRR